MSLFLLGLTFYYASKKHFRLSAVTVVLMFLCFIFAQFYGLGLYTLFHGLTLEQYLCWGFGLLFLLLAAYFIHEKALAYAFAVSLIAVFSCFCGFSSVQALLKTHMLWMVTDSLKSYGDKIDTYQTTLADIQKRLSEKQNEFESNQTVLITQINKQKKELDAVQSKIRDSETNIIGQQIDITNQYKKILLMQSALTSAQTNLDAQQTKLSDVEYWVQNLYQKTKYETFSINNTKSCYCIPQTNGSLIFLTRLQYVPIDGSIEVFAKDDSSRMESRIYTPEGILNILKFNLFNYDSNSITLSVHYVADIRQTNIFARMPVNKGEFNNQPDKSWDLSPSLLKDN